MKMRRMRPIFTVADGAWRSGHGPKRLTISPCSVAGQAEFGVNGCAAVGLGVGILQVGVAGCARADGDVFLAVTVENVTQGRLQQHRVARRRPRSAYGLKSA